MSPDQTPANILQIGFGFMASKTLLAAVKEGVFTALNEGPLTAEQLGSKLGFHPRGTYDFFDALVSLQLLNREGQGAQAKYSTTSESATFLDRSKPTYVGGILEMANDRLYPFWSDLNAGLKTGKPQNEVKHGNASMFETLYSDANRLEQFMSAMRGISYANFSALADKFDFSKYKTLCDVGGATGLLSSLVCKKHQNIQATSFDLPMVQPIAERHLKRDGVDSQVKAVSGNFFKDKLPRADVITMGMILHDWNLENKMKLIRLAYEALPEGGAFIAVENLIDDDRRTNVFGLMMSLNMLIEFGDAFDYTFADFKGWCQTVGFKRFEVIHLVGPASAAIAYK